MNWNTFEQKCLLATIQSSSRRQQLEQTVFRGERNFMALKRAVFGAGGGLNCRPLVAVVV